MTDGPSELNKTPRDGNQSKLSRESDSPLKSQITPSNTPMGDRSDAGGRKNKTMFPSKSPGKKGKKNSTSPPIPSGRLISVDNKPVRDGEGPDGEKTEKTSHM